MHVVDDSDVKQHLLDSRASQAFCFCDRIQTAAADAYVASQGMPKACQRAALEKRGKLSMYNRLGEDLQRLLDESRLREWSNYLDFGAAKIISDSEAERLVGLGAEELPAQWVERDKNEFKSLKGEHIDPDMKSQLVARGDLSKVCARSDSPTADKSRDYRLFVRQLAAFANEVW